MPRARHVEQHFTHRIGWLRAAVLGANDGIVSTAALVVGVAAAHSGRSAVLLAGLAGMVAGAMSMAAGEYVSVSSQADTEKADLARERKELAESPEAELHELQQIYVKRGLDADLAFALRGSSAPATSLRRTRATSWESPRRRPRTPFKQQPRPPRRSPSAPRCR